MATHEKRGDSSVQRKAEPVIRAKLEKDLGVNAGDLSKSTSELLGEIDLDGFLDGIRPICVEIWAHQGKARSAQKDKVLKDMCKLLLAEDRLKKSCRKIIAVADEEAVAHLKNSWQGEFAEVFGIDINVVEIPKTTKRDIREAQKKQYR